MNWLLVTVGIVFFICMLVGYIRGFIKIVVSLAATIATIVLVTILTPYVGGAIAKFTPMDEMVQEKCMAMLADSLEDDIEAELPRQKQIEFLEQADIPVFFRNSLIENNNSEVYSKLNVSGFQEYVGAYLADIVIKMAAFLLTFIIVTILVRAVIFALDIITALPVIKGLNRIAGIGIGVLIAVIIVWIGFFVITLLYDTSIGRECFAWIQESEFLTFLYNENMIMRFATKL